MWIRIQREVALQSFCFSPYCKQLLFLWIFRWCTLRSNNSHLLLTFFTVHPATKASYVNAWLVVYISMCLVKAASIIHTLLFLYSRQEFSLSHFKNYSSCIKGLVYNVQYKTLQFSLISQIFRLNCKEQILWYYSVNLLKMRQKSI